MTRHLDSYIELPPEQQAIREKCFHPSGTFVEFPIEDVASSIPERFEKIVQLYPNRVAVKADDRSITYIELNALANRVARSVLSKRLGEAVPVGIQLEKGIEQTAAMLGVLKAGRFFVLLDPSFPQSRIDAMLEDSGARVVISDETQGAAAQQRWSATPQCIAFKSIADEHNSQNLCLAIPPSEYAYLVYTSGSTGRPKAVIQTHRNLQHRVMLHTRENRVGEQDRMALLPNGTSNAITNTFNALLTGATLCPFDVKKNGVRRLAHWLVEERISVCLISSMLFRSLCQNLDDTGAFPDLRFVRFRSEPAYKSDVELFRKHFSPSCTLVNGLSSTETGPLCALFISSDTQIPGDELPVGYVALGKTVLLLDDEGKEVGVGEIGEIVVRSRYLSPGYWRRPELSEAKFKTDPKGSDERLYYTGDLGLLLADGCLIHKGRKDFRVKIRGYGVEIAEVENALRRHPAIRDTVVVGRDNGSTETRLVGFFMSATQPAPSTSELRRYMSKLLPDYMVPSAFVRLDTLPLTPNGKIDRAGLPEPTRDRPELDVAYVEPRSVTENELAQIWAQVLSLDKVGIHDNFFELGGHSLAASRVVAQVVNTFQLDLPLRTLFDAPTVAEMAAIITQNQAKRASDAVLAQLLREVEAMSEEEAEKRLTNDGVRS
jgi:amino acid adenylation domain-containing protein